VKDVVSLAKRDDLQSEIVPLRQRGASTAMAGVCTLNP
jgi:hypothetical protein